MDLLYKTQSNPITGLDRPWGFQEVEAPRFQDSRHMKVVRLSALRTGRLYHSRKYSWYSFLLEAESTPWAQCGRKDYDTIGNRTRDLPACRAVPQPTVPPAACPGLTLYVHENKKLQLFVHISPFTLKNTWYVYLMRSYLISKCKKGNLRV